MSKNLVQRTASVIYWSISAVWVVALLATAAVCGWLFWTAMGDSKELRELTWFAVLFIGLTKGASLIMSLHAWSRDARKR
jgi:hypothetical protein